MKIERFHTTFTHDVRFVQGKLKLNRTFIDQGLYVQDGACVHCQSTSSDMRQTTSRAELMELAQAFQNHHKKIFELQMVQTIRARRINEWQQHQDWLYFRINGGNPELIPFGPADKIFFAMEKALSQEEEHFSLPLYTKDFQYDQIVVSHSVFGHLLHESLGHRLESDDYSTPLAWGPVPNLNFSVYDCPGEEGMSGHTPFDDHGVAGREVCLFDPIEGRSELMSFETGNARATHYMNHPLIRQRCLDVRTLFPIDLTESERRLYLNKVELARYQDSETVISVVQAQIMKGNKQYRLPTIEISFSDEDIMRCRAFGEKKITEPPGGCHKGLQRGLNISYNTPRAFLSIEGEIRG